MVLKAKRSTKRSVARAVVVLGTLTGLLGGVGMTLVQAGSTAGAVTTPPAVVAEPAAARPAPGVVEAEPAAAPALVAAIAPAVPGTVVPAVPPAVEVVPDVASPDALPAAAVVVPTAESFAAIADYVSPDGSYARIGDVAISSARASR